MIEHPIVFISYSWDDEVHKEWVLDLANKLRTDGVDVILDRYYLRPGKNLPFFVEESIMKSNRIIIVLSPNYKLKAEKRIGGVGQEFSMINNELINNISENERVIPILKRGNVETSTPEFLKQYIYIDFVDKNEFDLSYRTLLRELYKEPEIKIPELGNKPNFDKSDFSNMPEKIGLDQIKIISKNLSNKSKEIRKNIAAEIYLTSSTLSISDMLTLIDSTELNYQIAAAIGLKSIIENLEIDLGSNPHVRRFVTIGLNHQSSFLRYRIMDLISVSDILKNEFDEDIKRLKEKERNKVVGRKINSVIKNESDQETARQNIRNLIAHSKTNQALAELEKIAKEKNDSDGINSVILLKARFASLDRDKNMGTISLDNVTRITNQINYAILNLLDGT